MPMTLEKIQAKAIKLPESSRIKLLAHLIKSLEKPLIEEDNIANAWTEEAIRRNRAIDANPPQTISAEEVLIKIDLKDRENEKGSI